MDIILLFLAKPLDKHGTTLVHITYPPLENSARDKCLQVVSGMILVREFVYNKSAKFYQPFLKLGSIQSEVVPNKGIHRKTDYKQMALQSLTKVH